MAKRKILIGGEKLTVTCPIYPVYMGYQEEIEPKRRTRRGKGERKSNKRERWS